MIRRPTSSTLLFLALIALFVDRAVGEDENSLTIMFVGDVMLDGGPGHLINNGIDPFEKCAALLTAPDLTVGNLECVLGKGGRQLDKPYIFRGASGSPPHLKRYFDALSLANNHSFDFGADGLVAMLDILDAAKIPRFGAGRNRIEARRPLILVSKGFRIALFHE